MVASGLAGDGVLEGMFGQRLELAVNRLVAGLDATTPLAIEPPAVAEPATVVAAPAAAGPATVVAAPAAAPPVPSAAVASSSQVAAVLPAPRMPDLPVPAPAPPAPDTNLREAMLRSARDAVDARLEPMPSPPPKRPRKLRPPAEPLSAVATPQRRRRCAADQRRRSASRSRRRHSSRSRRSAKRSRQ